MPEAEKEIGTWPGLSGMCRRPLEVADLEVKGGGQEDDENGGDDEPCAAEFGLPKRRFPADFDLGQDLSPLAQAGLDLRGRQPVGKVAGEDESTHGVLKLELSLAYVDPLPLGSGQELFGLSGRSDIVIYSLLDFEPGPVRLSSGVVTLKADIVFAARQKLI